jgi:DNA-binding transcriptional MerR regulator
MEGKRIGEIDKELGVRPGTLRYYETLGLLPMPRRSRTGYRLYDGEVQQRLRSEWRTWRLNEGMYPTYIPGAWDYVLVECVVR